MWVARVLSRSDEYMRRRTCRSCKAVNSKKLLPVPPQEKLAKNLLLVADHLEGLKDRSSLLPNRRFSGLNIRCTIQLRAEYLRLKSACPVFVAVPSFIDPR